MTVSDEIGRRMAAEVLRARDTDPTLEDLLRVALVARMDRVSLVREKRPGRSAGVLVLLLSAAAIREIGPYLRVHVVRLKSFDGQKIIASRGTPVRRLFEAIEQLGGEWGWFDFTIDTVACLLLMVVGPSVTDQVAGDLTRLGCMTRLK